ncbi:hypothetical protein D4R86_00260 [bacterium]|nr:MAG: hypothetical protein D4R86_00260 [bacterium]
MANWQTKLNISDIWNKAKNKEITTADLSKEIAKKLSALQTRLPKSIAEDESLVEEMTCLIEEFESASTDPDMDVDDFDSIMASLYDWADTSINDEWPSKKVCWINTIRI